MVASMSTFGQPSRYTYCIAENETQSPWESFSATKGFGPEENVVTVVACENPQIVVDDGSREPERLLVGIADVPPGLLEPLDPDRPGGGPEPPAGRDLREGRMVQGGCPPAPM